MRMIAVEHLSVFVTLPLSGVDQASVTVEDIIQAVTESQLFSEITTIDKVM